MKTNKVVRKDKTDLDILRDEMKKEEGDRGMKITKLYEIRTGGLKATKEEIATVLVNIEKGFKLKEINVDCGRLCFVMEEAE